MRNLKTKMSSIVLILSFVLLSCNEKQKEVDIYKYAKLVIVPSIWEEAYGRVSREAYILGLPILVSNIGGLPESVDYKEEFIVNDYKNIKNWVERIESNF